MKLLRKKLNLDGPKFSGIKTFMGINCDSEVENLDYIIAGIPFDTGGTYRVGARFAPSAIREISSTIKPYNYILNVNTKKDVDGVDIGDIKVIPGYIDKSYDIIEYNYSEILKCGVVPIIIGGDHSILLPELRAINKKYGQVALLQFDAHMDTIDNYFGEKYNHATSVRRAIEEKLIDPEHSMQLGIRSIPKKDYNNLGITYLTADYMRGIEIKEIGRIIKDKIGNKKVFLSFDIDFIDPAYAPGTGTMETCGFTSYEAMKILETIHMLNFIAFDIVEIIPAYDHCQITSLLAASIINFYISIIAKKKHRILDNLKKEDEKC